MFMHEHENALLTPVTECVYMRHQDGSSFGIESITNQWQCYVDAVIVHEI